MPFAHLRSPFGRCSSLAFAFLYYRYSGVWGTEIGGLARSSLVLAYVHLRRARRGARLRADPRDELGRARDSDFSARAAVRADARRHPDLVGEHLRLRGIAAARRVFERKHAEKTARVRAALKHSPTTIVTAWSFLPIVPTDLICYVCGVMRISFTRFMAGVLIGEGAICAIYIFAGNSLLDLGKRWLGA